LQSKMSGMFFGTQCIHWTKVDYTERGERFTPNRSRTFKRFKTKFVTYYERRTVSLYDYCRPTTYFVYMTSDYVGLFSCNNPHVHLAKSSYLLPLRGLRLISGSAEVTWLFFLCERIFFTRLWIGLDMLQTVTE